MFTYGNRWPKSDFFQLVVIYRYLQLVYPMWHKANFKKSWIYNCFICTWIVGPSFHMSHAIPTSKVSKKIHINIFSIRGVTYYYLDSTPVRNVIHGYSFVHWAYGEGAPSQWYKIVSLLRHSVCEEYKHSASVQSLLITPKTGLVNIQRWGGDVDTVSGLSGVFRMLNYNFSHAAAGGS